MEKIMNNKIRKFNQIVIEKRKDSIMRNGDYLDLVNSLIIDSFLKDPIEEIIVAYVLELDYVLSKSIPVLLERFLLELCIRANSKFKEDIVIQRDRFEEKNGKELIEELKGKSLLTEEEISVFESIYDKKNSINRNFEIHNRELKKIKNSEIKFLDSNNKESREFDTEAKKLVTNMVRTNPNFTYVMNRGKVKEGYQAYVNFIINFSFKYSAIINSLGSLMDKAIYEIYERQEKANKFKITIDKNLKVKALMVLENFEWIYNVEGIDLNTDESEIEFCTRFNISTLDLIPHIVESEFKKFQILK